MGFLWYLPVWRAIKESRPIFSFYYYAAAVPSSALGGVLGKMAGDRLGSSALRDLINRAEGMLLGKLSETLISTGGSIGANSDIQKYVKGN